MILNRRIWCLLFVFVTANTISAQDYCPEKRLLLEKYQAGDYIKAKAYSDTVILGAQIKKLMHISGIFLPSLISIFFKR